jgi:putative ABC transport system permease protein
MFLVARGAAGEGGLMTTARDALRTVDKDVPMHMAMPMEQVLADSVAPRRFSMLLISILGTVALTLATVGLYGVLSYSVIQRTREMGIRMALGAQRSHVIRLVVRQGMVLTLIGILVGLGASLALTRVMSSLLFGVSPTDVTTFLSITPALATVAFLASYLPARRATKVDPVVSLRFE